MIDNVRVTGYDEVAGLIAVGWPTHIISLIMREMPNYGAHHLHIFFDDIIRPEPGLVLPLFEHLLEVLRFTQNLTCSNRVLVHCQHGINRSPAVAIAILIQHGMDYADAYRQIGRQRSDMSPNRLIIRHIDHHFHLGGKLIKLRGAP